MRHTKKILSQYFQDIVDGKKTFEVRLADWECQEGDVLVLQEWDPEAQDYTGREVEKEVTYVVKTKDMAFWSQEEVEKNGYQILGFKE